MAFPCLTLHAEEDEEEEKSKGEAIIKLMGDFHTGFGSNNKERGFDIEVNQLGYEYEFKNGFSAKAVLYIGKAADNSGSQRAVYVKQAFATWEKNDFTFSYELDCSIEEKIANIVKKVYGGVGVTLTANAKKQAEKLTELGFDKCPVCVAKTQYSFSDDATKLGAPEGFTVTVRNLKISAGAGFIVVLTGDIMTMPGLPKAPAAERIDIDENGVITGLF